MTKKITDLVFIDDCRAVTTSIKVAEVFKKGHRSVLQDIKNLGCSERFSALNFESSQGFIEKDSGREEEVYLITRDGFTLLVMGYSGKKAMQFKEVYIEKFSEMESSLIISNHIKRLFTKAGQPKRLGKTGLKSMHQLIDKIGSETNTELKLAHWHGYERLCILFGLPVVIEKPII